MSDSNLSPRDLKIVFALTIAVVAISLVFPMMGLGSTGADDPREVPTMDIDTDRFDFAGDFPTRPDTGSSGVLQYNGDVAQSQTQRVFYEANNTAGFFDDGGGSVLTTSQISDFDALAVIIGANNNVQNGDPYAVTVIATNDQIPTTNQGYLDTSQVSFTDAQWVNTYTFGADDVGTSSDLRVTTPTGTPEIGATLRLDVSEASQVNFSDPNATIDDVNAVVDYRLVSEQTPDTSGFLSGLPGVGAASGVVGGIILFVQQIGWVFGTFVTLVVNGVSTIVQAFVFLGSLVSFVVGGYASVVVLAPGGLASLVLAFPGLLLGVQVIRLVMVFVNALVPG